MWLLNDGSFDAAGFEIDHELKWAQSYRHVGQLRALCAHCHNLKSRLELQIATLACKLSLAKPHGVAWQHPARTLDDGASVSRAL